jgi:SAM-dependent methyltransferase
MSYTEAFYNDHATEYSHSKLLPFRFIETFNFLELVKQILSNKDSQIVLDVACGDGFYTRKIKELMAINCKVIGVDISQEMINIAKKITDPVLDIDYIHYDGSKFAEPEFRDLLPVNSNGFVDHVSGVFFLNYAKNQEQLITYLKSVASVLKPGGFFFGLNDNPRDDGSWFNQNRFKEIGFDKYIPYHEQGERYEGQPVKYKMFNTDGTVLEITNYWIPPHKFKEAFKIAGFVDFEWVDMHHIPIDVRSNDQFLNDLYSKYSDSFDSMIKVAPVTFFKAKREY